jgi:FkbM family methyltransferase
MSLDLCGLEGARADMVILRRLYSGLGRPASCEAKPRWALDQDGSARRPLRPADPDPDHMCQAHNLTGAERLRASLGQDTSGAHVGIWTVPMALSRPAATVHAFEASPHTYWQLRSNIEANSTTNILATNAAVAAHDGTIGFQAPRNASVFGRIKSNTDSNGRYVESENIEVPCMRLATYCQKHGINEIEFLKIDVEGAELFVLRGLLPLLSTHRVHYIWTEIDSDDQIVAGNIKQLYELAESCGYSFYSPTDLATPVDIRAGRNANMLMRPTRVRAAHPSYGITTP